MPVVPAKTFGAHVSKICCFESEKRRQSSQTKQVRRFHPPVKSHSGALGALFAVLLLTMATFATAQGRLFERPSPERQIRARQIWEAQERLRDHGYSLIPDGKMGPRTRKSIWEFQKSEGLSATGHLDKPTLTKLRGLSDSGPLRTTVDLVALPALAYRLQDQSNNVILDKADHSQVLQKLNALLSDGYTQIDVYAKSLTDNAVDAVVSSWRIQQHKTGGHASIIPLRLAAPTISQSQSESAPIIRFERSSRIRRITSGESVGLFGAEIHIDVETDKGRRTLATRIVARSLELILEFLQRLGVLGPRPKFNQNLPLAALVARARADMKKAHPGLTDEHLRFESIDQFGNIRLARLGAEKFLS